MNAILENSVTKYNDYKAWEKVFANIGMFPETDRPALEYAKEQFNSFVEKDSIEVMDLPELSNLGKTILDWYF
ncbi:MAG: hypothetical protein JXA43_00745 [Candidatus Diapherotrites archaeon]|nr:hypothetical protein [Candidatus Diapherotrites archaeon]